MMQTPGIKAMNVFDGICLCPNGVLYGRQVLHMALRWEKIYMREGGEVEQQLAQRHK